MTFYVFWVASHVFSNTAGKSVTISLEHSAIVSHKLIETSAINQMGTRTTHQPPTTPCFFQNSGKLFYFYSQYNWLHFTMFGKLMQHLARDNKRPTGAYVHKTAKGREKDYRVIQIKKIPQHENHDICVQCENIFAPNFGRSFSTQYFVSLFKFI